jgi:hypothetical protein
MMKSEFLFSLKPDPEDVGRIRGVVEEIRRAALETRWNIDNLAENLRVISAALERLSTKDDDDAAPTK